jgi:hypothetical protein
MVLFAGTSGNAVATSDEMPDYPWDLRKKMPNAYRSYLKILPQSLRSLGWAGRFDGTGSPVERVIVEGRPYWVSSICKPHDCADNFVAFLVEADGSRAVALVKSRETRGKIIELGKPSISEREYLQQQFAD